MGAAGTAAQNTTDTRLGVFLQEVLRKSSVYANIVPLQHIRCRHWPRSLHRGGRRAKCDMSPVGRAWNSLLFPQPCYRRKTTVPGAFLGKSWGSSGISSFAKASSQAPQGQQPARLAIQGLECTKVTLLRSRAATLSHYFTLRARDVTATSTYRNLCPHTYVSLER